MQPFIAHHRLIAGVLIAVLSTLLSAAPGFSDSTTLAASLAQPSGDVHPHRHDRYVRHEQAEHYHGAAPIVNNNYYGAIATAPTGAADGWGSAVDYPTGDSAISAALAACQASSSNGCQLQLWFRNACGAVGETDTNFGWGYDTDLNTAESLAVQAAGPGAWVSGWACTTR